MVPHVHHVEFTDVIFPGENTEDSIVGCRTVTLSIEMTENEIIGDSSLS